MTQAKKTTAAQLKKETAAEVQKETAVKAEKAPAAEPKKETAPAAAAKKPAAKKPAAKKSAPKEKTERVENIFLQVGGREWNTAQLRDQAVAAYAAEGHRASGIKRLELYVKPEDDKAYFVINEKFEGSVEL